MGDRTQATSMPSPLTILTPWLLQPRFGTVPVLGLPELHHLLVAAAIVARMVYVVMPRYTRLFLRRLFG